MFPSSYHRFAGSTFSESTSCRSTSKLGVDSDDVEGGLLAGRNRLEGSFGGSTAGRFGSGSLLFCVGRARFLVVSSDGTSGWDLGMSGCGLGISG